jgi:glyoxylase-like metal-dependent hydrolase (beta-lactamase superfamily II)
MPLPTLQVGSITIISLSDGVSPSLPTVTWPNIQPDDLSYLSGFLQPDGMYHMNYGSFLIREDETWTLVDTGYGTRPDSKGGDLVPELGRAGVEPREIERVIITHLHGDHVGGATADVDGAPVPVYPNARHIVQREDWVYFQQPAVKAERPVIGLCADPLEPAGLLDLIDGGKAISTGISTFLTPGHTPGHQSVLISSGGEKVVILGDVSHSPIQLLHPDWSSPFDVDPIESAQTRAKLFERIEQEGLTVAAGHYPYPGFGGIVRVEGKRRWHPVGQAR